MRRHHKTHVPRKPRWNPAWREFYLTLFSDDLPYAKRLIRIERVARKRKAGK